MERVLEPSIFPADVLDAGAACGDVLVHLQLAARRV